MTHAIMAAHSFTTQAIEGLFDFYKQLKLARIRRRAIKTTEKELMRLSAKDLNDIGISRSEIYAIARNAGVIKTCIENKNLRGWV